ncbi:MAG: SGNH/GDSL hydrolase family protein [Patescibacteria group bacterium]
MKIIIAISLFILVLSILYTKTKRIDSANNIIVTPTMHPKKIFSFLTIGDSYTYGLGVKHENNWPNQLIKKLKSQGTNLDLNINPAVSGFTVRDAINIEVPLLAKEHPDFVIVLIGANDLFQMRLSTDFKKDYQELISLIQANLKHPNNVILLTIPDHTKTPAYKLFGGDPDNVKQIEEYNSIIKNEAKNKGLFLIDIFPVSQISTSSAYFIEDGVHPSALGYEKWVSVIAPKVGEFLRNL